MYNVSFERDTLNRYGPCGGVDLIIPHSLNRDTI